MSTQYLISVIHDQAGLATPNEHAAIDVFNERLQAEATGSSPAAWSRSWKAILRRAQVRDARGNCDGQVAGEFSCAGYNLTNDKTGTACSFTTAIDRVNKNPLLGHLASNGGPTKTLPRRPTWPMAACRSRTGSRLP